MAPLLDYSRSKNGLFLALGISALLKIGLALVYSDNAICRDGLVYISAAQQIAAGNFTEGLKLYPLALFPSLVALTHFIIPNWALAAKSISIISSILLLVPLYQIIECLFDREAAFWGSFALAIAPEPTSWAMEVIRGPVFLLFLLFAIRFFLLYIQTCKASYCAISLTLTWVASLFRVEGLIVIPLSAGYLLWLSATRSADIRQYCVGILLSVGSVFLIAFGIGYVCLYAPVTQFQDFLPSQIKGINFSFLGKYREIYGYLKTINQNAPFSGFKRSFIEFARHYMLIVYGAGFLELVIKVIYPLNVIPLFYGLKSRFNRLHFFVFSLAILYFGVIFYSLLNRDFISERFLFAPSVLLFPWVGLGWSLIMRRLTNRPHHRVLLLLIVGFVVCFQVAESVGEVRKNDRAITEAGMWLAKNTRPRESRIITSDLRILFAAGLEPLGRDQHLCHEYTFENYLALDRVVSEFDADVIAIRIPPDPNGSIPDIERFSPVKVFSGNKGVIVILRRFDAK